ncbi:MAG: large-conductance mechanosensitive channel protein MscL [Patescibacteria group bacterium]
MFKDFKTFITRGNVMDLAVGVIIGGAFGKIVSSLVADILTPVISLLTGGIDFSGLKVRVAGTDTAPIYLTYGKFIQTTIDFLIIAAVIFFMVRAINKLHKSVTAPVTTRACPRCTMPVNIAATRCPHCTSELT